MRLRLHPEFRTAATGALSRRPAKRRSGVSLAGSLVLAVATAALAPAALAPNWAGATTTTVPSATPAQEEAQVPSVAPTKVPSVAPTQVPSVAPTNPDAPAASGVPNPLESKASTVTLVAAARNRMTPAYETANATKPFKTFDNRMNFSGRHVFVVLAQVGNSYRVQLPMRPNGRVGYVKTADVTLYQHDFSVKVDLSDHTLIVYKGGREIQRDTVAVGQSKYPTPTGLFYIRELAKPGNPKGSYGPWAFGLSAYSNVLQKFGRGDGQIGIHGTNQPRALGTNASHGCIRMPNASITRLANMLPQGVPIEIVA